MRSDRPSQIYHKTTTSQMDKIDNYIYIGDHNSAIDYETLKSFNIVHIHSLYQVEIDPNERQNFNQFSTPIPRGHNVNILQFISPSIRFIHECVQKKEKVLVHCKHGVNRSVSIVIAYYMATKGVSFFDALKIIRKRRRVNVKRDFEIQIDSIKSSLRSCLVDPN